VLESANEIYDLKHDGNSPLYTGAVMMMLVNGNEMVAP
jgi:hypothetical protein